MLIKIREPIRLKNRFTSDPKANVIKDWFRNELNNPINVSSLDSFYNHITKRITDKDDPTSLYVALSIYEMNHSNGRPKPVKIGPYEIAMAIAYFFDVAYIARSANSSETDKKFYYYQMFDDQSDYGTYQLPKTGGDPITELAESILSTELTLNTKRMIETYLETYTPILVENNDPNIIPVKNGLFYKKEKKLKPFTPDIAIMRSIQTNYYPSGPEPILHEPNGNPWRFTEWLDDLGENDADRITLFWQTLSAAFNPGRVYNKALIFYSRAGNNGKGTFGQLIKNIIGPGNYSSLTVDLYGERFKNFDLLGKICNIADENPVGVYLDKVSDFKAAVTGDDVIFEQKHQTAFNAQIKHITIQMMNELPNVRDKSGSFYRRLLIVPFFHSFTGREKRYIREDFMNNTQLKEWVLAKALEMDYFDDFIEPKSSTEAKYNYKVENNPVYEFWDEFAIQFAWNFVPKNFAYDLYIAWMARYNKATTPMNSRNFYKYTEDWIDEQQNWISKADRSSNTRTASRLNDDEPLITEYQLTNWYDPTYMGTDPKKRRTFPRDPNKLIRGYERTP